jgi:hypothetical protein
MRPAVSRDASGREMRLITESEPRHSFGRVLGRETVGQAAAGVEQVTAARIAMQRIAGGHEPSGKGEHDEAWALRCHSDRHAEPWSADHGSAWRSNTATSSAAPAKPAAALRTATSFLGQLGSGSQVASTVPADGDVNP